MSNRIRAYVYVISFTSGLTVRTVKYETNIQQAAERLRDSYAEYYNISHDIMEISCENC
jgi:hypothetical protein